MRRRIGQPQYAFRIVDILFDAQQFDAQQDIGQLHTVLRAALVWPVHVTFDLLFLDDLV